MSDNDIKFWGLIFGIIAITWGYFVIQADAPIEIEGTWCINLQIEEIGGCDSKGACGVTLVNDGFFQTFTSRVYLILPFPSRGERVQICRKSVEELKQITSVKAKY